MTPHPRAGIALLAVAALAVLGHAQQQEPEPPGGTLLRGPEPDQPFEFDGNFGAVRPDAGDYVEACLAGGFVFRWPALGLEVHGQTGLVLTDRDETNAMLRRDQQPTGLPRRGLDLPFPRRKITPAILRARLENLLRAAGRSQALTESRGTELVGRLPRYLYFEGNVVVVRQGVEIARAARMWVSPLDDRLELEDAELRYVTTTGKGAPLVLTVRGHRLTKQGPRWTGRDLTVTSCDAGEPHVAVLAGEVEIVERPGQFEILGRDVWLQFSGRAVVPLPDAHFFTGEQSEFPIKGASAGYSASEGAHGEVQLGLGYNDVGGALHEFLTGGDPGDFRGSWLLGVGWNEARGFPLDGSIDYRSRRYEGRTDVFYLDDEGRNIREITANIDGSPITTTDRVLARTENRILLGEQTHLDLTAFHASDPAVYSEFFRGDYRTRELPETSAYFTHGVGNWLLTVDARLNLDEFALADNRALAPAFTEELPVATMHWIAQPIATTPWDTPIVLDTATELGQRRHNLDDRLGLVAGDRTLRVDQVVELSAPFALGVFSVRPFANARYSWFDNDAANEARDRLAYAAGVGIGTRLARTWTWTGADGSEQALRHVIAPLVVYEDRFHVDGDPSLFRQFDEVDALTESQRVRFGARQLVQRMTPPTGDAPAEPRDVVFADVMQNVFPDAGRDNAGETWGLLEYEVLLRPGAGIVPLSTFALGFEGEHDWRDGMRTFNAEARAGRILGVDWLAGYRSDRIVQGSLGFGASAHMFDRWHVFGSSQYDLDTSEWRRYSFGLDRIDHDWTVRVGVSYDPFTDDIAFRVEFAPRFGGLLGPRDTDFFAGQRLAGGGTATDF